MLNVKYPFRAPQVRCQKQQASINQDSSLKGQIMNNQENAVGKMG